MAGDASAGGKQRSPSPSNKKVHIQRTPDLEEENPAALSQTGLTGPAAFSLLGDDRVPAANRQALARQLGRRHGNSTLQRALAKSRPLISSSPGEGPAVQRDLLEGLGASVEGLLGTASSAATGTIITDPLGPIFDQVVATNIGGAASIAIPGSWRSTLMEYAAANPVDGAILLVALTRGPRFWSGGWIMDVQPDAAAMTLDRNIFVSGNLSLATYIHELVHVTQYGTVGRTGFLVSYFGLSALTIAKRFLSREPINMMRSSPHEEQAYQLEQRFVDWYQTQHGANAHGITASS